MREEQNDVKKNWFLPCTTRDEIGICEERPSDMWARNEELKVSVEGIQSRCCHCVVYDLAVSCLFFFLGLF